MEWSPWNMIAVVGYLFGVICAVLALWRSRTQQGATAWMVALLGFPWLAVPLFLVFGHSKFLGYVNKRKQLDRAAQKEAGEAEKIYALQVEPPKNLSALSAIAKSLGIPGFMGKNSIHLLVDGQQTYDVMFEEIKKAKKYILFQFYIVNEDPTGKRFAEALIARAKAGVRVYFMYDGVGTRLSKAFVQRLTDAGIEVGRFQSTKSWTSRFQINFRNHRKLVVVDGNVAMLGGVNIGDDYLGLNREIGRWRDTHVLVCGPAALASQLSFMKDWYWIKERMPDLDWDTTPAQAQSEVMMLHTGPADEGDACLLAHLALIHAAKTRIWISNPYIVPPESLLNALSLASLRGVDVRLIFPAKNDNRWVAVASEVFMEKMQKEGVKFFKFTAGFCHQKVILIDHDVAVVGSANLDSRSLFINFELMALSLDQKFIREVEQMLVKDFSHSRLLPDLTKRTFWRQLYARAVSLASPML